MIFRKKPKKPSIPAPPVQKNTNRRLISGDRVLCQCSMDLPKLDPFSGFKASRQGFMVLNVRGACLYLAQQINLQEFEKVFPDDKPSTIKNVTLFMPEGPVVELGDIKVRLLRFAEGVKLTGIVLRFAGLSEKQLDLLNALPGMFPPVDGDEESAIPIDQLSRM